MEQLRFVLGNFLASKNGLDTVWPVQVVLFANQKEYGPHALDRAFVNGGSATLSAWTGDKPLSQEFLRDLTLLLIRDNAGPLPDSTETALGDLFSTIQVNATHVTLGAAPADLPEARRKAWARAQLLATNGDYAGKLRVYLNNLQQAGDEGAAVKNAFDITTAEMDKRVDAYLKTGNFAGVAVIGKALSPNRDFVEKPVEDSALAGVLAELAAQGKSFPEDSPRGLSAKGTPSALELAIKANPRWAEPHVKLAAMETNPQATIQRLKTATSLEPRNGEYWQTLARVQESAQLFDEAAKSWASAEKAAPNEQERARIHLSRMEESEKRAEFDISERKRLAAERAAELEALKQRAAAEVHAAEAAANARLGGLASGTKPVAWWDEQQGEHVTGSLTQVDCLATGMRLTIARPQAALLRLSIEDPKQITVREGTFQLACGVQKPPRKIEVVHDGKANPKLGVAGSIKVVGLPK